MALKLQLSSAQGSSVMYHHCHHTAEPIQLYNGDEPVLVVMDSHVFAKAYGNATNHYDMHNIFQEEGMDAYISAAQIRKTVDLIPICNQAKMPIVVKKYGWDIVVAMSPAEYEKRQHRF